MDVMCNNNINSECGKVLTVIVPAYNMERCLERNLSTYVSDALCGRLSVVVLDNSSEDATLAIARRFEEKYPDVFTVITKKNDGYGGSVNLGIELCRSKYLKVIDADDHADTKELVALVDSLETCEADVVETPYYTVDVKSGVKTKIPLSTEFGKLGGIEDAKKQSPFPSLHTTALRVDFVRQNPFTLLTDAYYVDEELAIYPFFYARTVEAFDTPVYCYSVNDDGQSVSIANKVKNLSHRDRIVKRLMAEYEERDILPENRDFCFRRVARSVGDHFTTLLVLHIDRREGRRLSSELKLYIKENHPAFLKATRKKRMLLSMVSRLGISYSFFCRLKKLFGYKETSSL